MNKNVQIAWAQALESGDYEKGTGSLWDAALDTYCCLGVLCDLATRAGVIHRDHYGRFEVMGEDGHWELFVGGTLPVVVRDWACLHDTNPVLDPEAAPFSLTMGRSVSSGTAIYVNDVVALPFVEIAALVRALP